VSFSINTNVTSLQAQNNLRNSSDFQAKTINRVTSGLRIVSSGDDAAGLAIANGFRSDQAVLNQGIRNAGDGLNTLQTIDSGMNNISMLLDRARTLSTQSASGTFAGDRTVLNNEFQNVLTEIDRQSTAIGMNTGGQFAKNISVFIGGGKDANGIASNIITNGSVGVDLSKSTVDTQSLGMKGFAAGYQVNTSNPATPSDVGLYDLGASSNSSVSKIIAHGLGAGAVTTTTFILSGPGFSDAGVGTGAATITVNLSGVGDTTSLVNAINAGIQGAAGQGTAAAGALKAANIVAEIHTGADGHQQLLFSSAGTSFGVAAGDIVANAFLGNSGTNIAGAALNANATGEALVAGGGGTVAGGTAQLAVNYTTGLLKATPETQALTFTSYDGSGSPFSTQVLLTGTGAAGANQTAAEAAGQINAQLQATDVPSLQKIVATVNAAGTGIVFSSTGTRFDMSIGVNTGTAGDGIVATAGTLQGVIAQGTTTGVGGTADISNQATAEAAVGALSQAVSKLGAAQANVGKGENQFNYAMNLAQSQSTNLAAAESRIRDADLATEAANLTKAQILMQAGTAALAQANSAPQAILSLLK
jgi:flagellin